MGVPSLGFGGSFRPHPAKNPQSEKKQSVILNAFMLNPKQV